MFNTKQEYTTYTVMINRAANGFILQLLDSDGEIARTAIATEYGIRDYSSNSLCSAIEELWGYAEKLVKDEAALTAELAENFDTVAEARESEL
jgi:hypothetical protein